MLDILVKSDMVLTMRTKKDRFGRKWTYPTNELCPKCGQPDTCGDCNHKRLTNKEVEQILRGTCNETVRN